MQLSNFTCRSFSDVSAQRCQKRALTNTVSSVVCATADNASERALLGAFQHVVVVLALTLDKRGVPYCWEPRQNTG